MSVQIICDQCGTREEPGVAGFEWWEVSNKASGEDLDFCSAHCIEEYFARRAGPADRHPAEHATRNGV